MAACGQLKSASERAKRKSQEAAATNPCGHSSNPYTARAFPINS